MENIINTYGLEISENQGYDTVFFDLFADYEKNCLLFGRRVEFVPYDSVIEGARRVVKNTDICCVLKFNLNDEGLSDSLKKAVSEVTKDPVFYKVHPGHDKALVKPYEDGFARIPNEKGAGDQIYQMSADDNASSIKGYIDQQLRQLEGLNVPAFKAILSDWVRIHPETLFNDREKTEPIYDVLHFIHDWQFLMLSEDKELRDLYLKYMEKYDSCYCSKMTMDR